MKNIKLYSCLLLISISSFMPLKVLAVSTDINFYSSNDILFYDNCSGSSSSSGSGSGSGTGVGDAAQAQNLEAILRYFTGKGLSLASAAAIAGNLVMESGLYPARIQGNGIQLASDDYVPVDSVGFGLAQWTFSSRQQPLIDLAKTQGKKITDMTLQLDYIWQELTTGYPSTLEKLNSIKSETTVGGDSAPMAAAIIFHDEFERSADSDAEVRSNRGGAAEDFYSQYKGKITDGTGVTGIGSSTVGASSSGSSSSSCGGSGGVAGATIDQEKLYEASDTIDCAPGTTEAIKSQPVDVGHSGNKINIKLCYIPDTIDSDSEARSFDSVITVNSRVSGAWLALINEIRTATGDKIIKSGSSFRTYDMQLTNGNYFSNHEMGIAVDFQTIYTCVGGGIGSTLSQGSCPYFDLLKFNKLGEKYGFQDRQSPYEAWHWEPKGIKY